MGFAFRAIDAVFDANMHLQILKLQPKSTARTQIRRLFNFTKAEQPAVKLAGRSFSIFRNGNLRVMNTQNQT
jgi:hypothetical protein